MQSGEKAAVLGRSDDEGWDGEEGWRGRGALCARGNAAVRGNVAGEAAVHNWVPFAAIITLLGL